MSAWSMVQEIVDALSSRRALIDALIEEPMDKRDLHTALDVSRSTVDRGVRELEVLGLVERSQSELRPTLCGRLAHDEHRAFEHRIENVLDAQSVLSALDPETDIPISVLVGAEIIPAETAAPHVPGPRIENLIREAERCRLLSRAHAHADSVDLVHERIMQDGLEGAAVFGAEVFEHLRSNHAESIRAWMATGRFDLLSVDGLPFGLFLTERADETRVCLVAYDRDNTIVGLLINDTDAAVEWGERAYHTYEDRATSVEV